jgi:hypothetical protein
MDFLRYVTGFVIFLSASLVLSFSVHRLLVRHTKRKNAALSGTEQ